MTTPDFHSILYPSVTDRPPHERTAMPEFFRDLNLDQIVTKVTAPKQEYRLDAWFFAPLHSVDAIVWRQEIMRELEIPSVFAGVKRFEDSMRATRANLAKAEAFSCELQKQRWFLAAVATYCETVTHLSRHLSTTDLESRGLSAFRDALARYETSERFAALVAQAATLTNDLAAIRYNLVIDGLDVEVGHFGGQSDYSRAVEATFERFKASEVPTHAFKFPSHEQMHDVEARILDGVAHLFPELFSRLCRFYEANQGFIDDTVAAFEREIQFYVAVLEHIASIKRHGLSFCFPDVVAASKDVESCGGFDLALAKKLADEGRPVVTNDFRLNSRERIVVVSGPNQGGKTTFARTFGQLHYLASLGCPVPGTRAQLFLFDQMFTHFERAEKFESLHGKLQDDLLRVRDILDRATPRSIIIMNEIFTSTTMQDAILLSKKIASRIIALDALCVWVTFLVELASVAEQTVSMISTVAPENPAERTYKIIRAPANDLAYAMSIAEKYGLTYAAITEHLAE